ncbi:MAG: DUF6261 family protein [Luteolibacter sp.]
MQSLHTSLLTTEELTIASARLLPLINPLLTGQSILVAIATAAETNRAAIVKAASRQAASDFTDPLKESDATRDAAFTALRDFSGTWAKNPSATPEQRAAGARLVQIFALHGNTLHRLGYTRQSGKMTALIADLNATGPAADFTTLDLLPLFTQMTAAHAAFEGIVADKAATEGGNSLPTLAEHRPELERQLNLLLSTIDEWHDLSPSPASTAAIGKIDEVIVQIATPALARRTRSQEEPAPTPGS